MLGRRLLNFKWTCRPYAVSAMLIQIIITTLICHGNKLFFRFIGGLYGRFIGRVFVHLFGVHMFGYWAWMDPGAFALLGAASFFGGVSRLTMSLTVIMVTD